MRKKNKFYWAIAFIVILFFAVLIRLPQILHFDIPFTYDTGLTLLEIRDIVLLKGLRLIGPEGGIKGIFFGPTWYYLISVIFFLSHGDPRSVTILSFLLNISSIFVAWKIGNKINGKTGLVAALIFAFSWGMISYSSSGFVVVTFVLINLIAVYLLLSVYSKKSLFLLVFLASFSFHFEPIVAIGFNLALFIVLFDKLRKLNIKDKLMLFMIWLLPFVPQILFDIRHNFLQTHAIIDELAHFGHGLGGSLPLGMRLINRPLTLIDYFLTITSNHNVFLALLLFFYLLVGLLNEKSFNARLVVKYCLYLWLVPFLYYIFLFPPGIKNWYYVSFPAMFCLLIAIGLSSFSSNRFFRLSSIVTLVLFMYINTKPIGYLKSLTEGFPSQDPSSLKNEIDLVKWIYKDASGKPFNVFTYSPAVYDYPYQYLFWWYPQKNGLPFPKDFSYRPKTNDYIPNKLFYTPTTESNDVITTYLIFFPFNEQYHRYWTPEHFREPFRNTLLIAQKDFPGGVSLEKRITQQ